MNAPPTLFDLSAVFSTVVTAVHDHEMLAWRERRLTYSEVDHHIDALAAYLQTVGLGCHTERKHLAPDESGQDHMGILLRNGTEYLEARIAGYRARAQTVSDSASADNPALRSHQYRWAAQTMR
jgi:3-oxocholest-4-en-26-oate---CoA ligase